MAIRKTRRQVVMDAAAIGALYASGWGQSPAVVEAAPVPAPVPTVNDLMGAFVAEMVENGVADPLREEFTLGMVWYDLCQQAGEEPPAEVAALVDTPAIEPRNLSVFYPLDDRSWCRRESLRAAHAAIIDAARRYRDGDLDEGGLADAAHVAMIAAWQLGEDKALGAKIVAHQARVAERPHDDDLPGRLAYLTGLAARWEYRASHGDGQAVDMLARLNRCLDLPIDCLDGSFGRTMHEA